MEYLQNSVTQVVEVLNSESDFKRLKNVKQIEENARILSESQRVKINEVITQLTAKLELLENDTQSRRADEEHLKRMEIMNRELEDIQYSIDEQEKSIERIEDQISRNERLLEELKKQEEEIEKYYKQKAAQNKYERQLYFHIAPIEWDLVSGKRGNLFNDKAKENVFIDLNDMSNEDAIEAVWDQLTALVE